MYWILLFAVTLLTVSGCVGSDAYMIGVFLGGILIAIGFAIIFKRCDEEEKRIQEQQQKEEGENNK